MTDYNGVQEMELPEVKTPMHGYESLSSFTATYGLELFHDDLLSRVVELNNNTVVGHERSMEEKLTLAANELGCFGIVNPESKDIKTAAVIRGFADLLA